MSLAFLPVVLEAAQAETKMLSGASFYLMWINFDWVQLFSDRAERRWLLAEMEVMTSSP